ncbi:hypothetical protein [Streptomyces antimicrobicus]|uniref:Uncharacterized protein n=1 Tax=Streptomyces antimicrobicus TaxID=2883108 RepID=A0ABS8B3Y7_9ACTN|nr:hypothetical protein [Streptomyces antimicrobicus]MCB5179335.1 hypothetical protein [Streptomyces antimicrobicus]
MTAEGSSYHYGDVVNLHGGHHNVGIQHHWSPPVSRELPDDQRAAVEQLLELLRQHRDEIAAEDQEELAEALPVIASAARPVPERRRALRRVAGVAATTAALGQPVVDLVNGIIALLGPA